MIICVFMSILIDYAKLFLMLGLDITWNGSPD